MQKSDVIMFLASTFNRKHPPFPNRPKPTSLFVLHTMEQPMYATMLNDHRILKKFNLLAMYSQESVYPGSGVPNLPMTYYPLHVYPPSAVLSTPKSFKEKDGYGTGKASPSRRQLCSPRCDHLQASMLSCSSPTAKKLEGPNDSSSSRS